METRNWAEDQPSSSSKGVPCLIQTFYVICSTVGTITQQNTDGTNLQQINLYEENIIHIDVKKYGIPQR